MRESPESLFVLAFDGDRVIGASTGDSAGRRDRRVPAAVPRPGIALTEVFYFGESVLLGEYRGHGLGHRFFDEREGYARRLGRFAMTAFCAVERAADDPRAAGGFSHQRRVLEQARLSAPGRHVLPAEWQEIGTISPSSHRLRFWLRALESA